MLVNHSCVKSATLTVGRLGARAAEAVAMERRAEMARIFDFIKIIIIRDGILIKLIY